jgi:hypothetical protein
MARHWTLPQRDLFEPPPSVNRFAAIERRKALELLQALLGEAINAPQERKAEKPLEVRDDKNIA